MPENLSYQRTHPWLTFHVDLRDTSHRLWMLLGEAQSKARHVGSVPLLPVVRQRLMQLYLVKGALATVAIEGNTLTEEQAIKVAEGTSLKLPPSQEYLEQELANILAVSNELALQTRDGTIQPLSPETICNFNGSVLRDLKLDDPDIVPGQVRRTSVGVPGYRGGPAYRGAPAQECEALLRKLCEWLSTDYFDQVAGPGSVAGAILKAIIAHIYIAWIHPFGDGNGRTARLVELQILLAAGVPDTAAHLLSNHYNQTRAEYYRQLAAASGTGGDLRQFIEYSLEGFVGLLKQQIEVIKQQQLVVHWVNYVHDRFRDTESSASQRRRRRLAIDLLSAPEPVAVSKVRQLSPAVAEDYATLTDRTIKRDLEKLEQMRLVTLTDGAARPNIGVMVAFVPSAETAAIIAALPKAVVRT